MKIEVVYCYPLGGVNGYRDQAERFVGSYVENDPMVDHRSTIVCNGGDIDGETQGLFSLLPSVRFIQHDNSGYDIGSFQAASEQSTADMIVFFGTSAYVKGKGWLFRMAEAFFKHGENQYGCMGNRGDERFGVFPHLRTTGIWTSPRMFNAYPHRIVRPDQRFPFEHGPNCFTSFVSKIGRKNLVVTHSGEFEWADWDSIPNGFHRSNQSDLLSGDRLSEPPYYHTA